MSDVCANPDCGHPAAKHDRHGCTVPSNDRARDLMCWCTAFVVDGGRPEGVAERRAKLLADQPVTDALAKVLAEQRWQGHYLILNGWSERTRQEVASTLAAVLSERFVITPRENT